MANWIRRHHPEMLILINDNPGTPSQLFANCQLVENSDVMSDLDLEAGRALGSAMSSMDYFADHDESRWARQVMTDLSRGCSIGMPFWIPMNGPDDYVKTWQGLYDFSGKTTALPIVPDSRAVSSNMGPTVGSTVWAGKTRLMAAAMDHRESGPERQTTLTIRAESPAFDEDGCRITRLTNRVQPVKDHGWRVIERIRSRLVLRGPLSAGELILIEQDP